MIKNKLWKTWQIRKFSFVLQAFFMPEYQVTVLIWDFYYYLFFLWEKNKYVVVEKKKNRNKNNKKMHFDLSKNLSPYKCDCFFVVTGKPKKRIDLKGEIYINDSNDEDADFDNWYKRIHKVLMKENTIGKTLARAKETRYEKKPIQIVCYKFFMALLLSWRIG